MSGCPQTNCCRCPQNTSAVFLYRKVAAQPPRAIMLEAPDFEADNAVMDKWLKAYLAALDQADPEHEDEEPGMRPSIPCPSLDADCHALAPLDLSCKAPTACHRL